VPFSLELLALRRLTTGAFGTLMSLEPAIALVVGLVVLHQVPGTWPVVGIAFVVAAGIGAERTGSRGHQAPAGASNHSAVNTDHSAEDPSAPEPTRARPMRSGP
jgi:inner membrane transporter RhtA